MPSRCRASLRLRQGWCVLARRYPIPASPPAATETFPGDFLPPITQHRAGCLISKHTHGGFGRVRQTGPSSGISTPLLALSRPVPSPSGPVANLFREASEKGERNAIHSAAPAPSDTLCLPIQFIKDFLLVRSNRGAGMPPADHGLCRLQNANSMGIR